MDDLFADQYLGYLIFWVLVGGLVAGLIWDNKGGGFGSGFLMGALLGIIGIILAAAMTPEKDKRVVGPTGLATALRECPHCRTPIRRDASVCPHCQRESEAWIFHGDRWWVKRAEGYYWRDEKSGDWNLVSNEEAEAQRAKQAAARPPA
ncbi:MAG TPA: zinc ribbon domain-containing protein [Actinomycetota bacterium]|jgi:uncharacterized membrane protein YeaQ/YmgE (transglycosylase-associated protein family)